MNKANTSNRMIFVQFAIHNPKIAVLIKHGHDYESTCAHKHVTSMTMNLHTYTKTSVNNTEDLKLE